MTTFKQWLVQLLIIGAISASWYWLGYKEGKRAADKGSAEHHPFVTSASDNRGNHYVLRAGSKGEMCWCLTKKDSVYIAPSVSGAGESTDHKERLK